MESHKNLIVDKSLNPDKIKEMKILIVVDYQNDFVTGSLGSQAALDIYPNVKAKIEEYKKNKFPVIFTKDTHFEDYPQTQEGKNLPVSHCVWGSEGHNIYGSLDEGASVVLEKYTFGDLTIADNIKHSFLKPFTCPKEIEIIGVATDICVISNAAILKAAFPETLITVDASCCAGITPELHEKALDVMESFQVKVINRE